MPPLSMVAVTTFRDAHRRGLIDHVRQHGREGTVTLTTSVSDGALREIELTFAAETHRLMREVLAFPGLGRVEIADDTAAVTRPGYIPPARTPSGRASAITDSRRPSRDDLDKAELRARLVLSQRNIDMGRAVQVSRTVEGVRVRVEEGSPTIPIAERRATTRLLEQIDLVRLDFTPPTPVSAPVSRFRLQQWLVRTFADARTRVRFGPTLMQSLETVQQRLTVLASLAERYPDPRHQLSATTRPMLQQLVDLEYRRLRTELNESRELVSTLSGSAHAAYDGRETPPSLLACAPRALSRARTFERLVREITASRDDLTDTDSQRLNAGFATLWESVYGPSPARP
jgi:hypothetical protein